MDVKVKVIKKFNEELGSSLKNLKEIEQIHMRLEYDKTKVEEHVSITLIFFHSRKLNDNSTQDTCAFQLSLASSEAPSKIQEAVEEVNQIINCMSQMKSSCKSVCASIEERLQQESKTSELQTIIDDISYLERSSLYLQFVKFIEDLRYEMIMKIKNSMQVLILNVQLLVRNWKYLYFQEMMRPAFLHMLF